MNDIRYKLLIKCLQNITHFSLRLMTFVAEMILFVYSEITLE